MGEKVPEEYTTVFDILAAARDPAIDKVRDCLNVGKAVYGWEVDDAARNVITKAGYGDYFVHRTGHSIGLEVHGKGCNIDSLETIDERQLIPRTGFSIEPGIYLDDFGVRSEIDVYMEERGVEVTTAVQDHIIPLLA